MQDISSRCKTELDEYLKLFINSDEYPDEMISSIKTNFNIQEELINYIYKTEEVNHNIFDLQNYTFKMIIPIWEKHLRGDYSFVYNETVCPDNIIVSYENQAFIHINIYERKIYRVYHSELQVKKEELSNIQDELNDINKRIKELEKYHDNILSMGNTIFEKIKILFSQNKSKKRVRREHHQLTDRSLILDKEKARLNIRIENIDNNIKSYEIRQERIIRYFKRISDMKKFKLALIV